MGNLLRDHPLLTFVASLAALVLISQAIVVMLEYFLRWKRFRQARSFAKARGKLLLVIGRPGTPVRIYGCGDVCLDADPLVLKDCPAGGLVGDIRDIPFEDAYFGAVFCSHIVEFLPTVADAQQAMAEMTRVADRLFLCYTLRLNLLWGWFGPTTQLWICRRNNVCSIKKRPW